MSSKRSTTNGSKSTSKSGSTTSSSKKTSASMARKSSSSSIKESSKSKSDKSPMKARKSSVKEKPVTSRAPIKKEKVPLVRKSSNGKIPGDASIEKTKSAGSPRSKKTTFVEPTPEASPQNEKVSQKIQTMVGEIEAGATNWGNEESQLARVWEDASNISSNIRVALRCRPPNKRELSGGEGGGVIVKVPGRQASDGIVEVEKTPFTFDLAFPMETTQLEVFESVGIDIVNCAFHGYNASLFAYGQTSSGKSFSMMGVANSDLVGLIPRISRLLFTASANTDKSFLIETSYLEIYNEKLRDLLSDGSSSDDASLKIRENAQLGVHVEGLNREVVTCAEDTLAVIDHGFNQRTTAATLYNSESSRSHAVFEINLQARYQDTGTGEDMVSSSRIALIDLAGSERSDKLGSKGAALKEGNNINKSLTVLGRCIRALVDISKGKKISVPFRESVLTWYLRDSLAGNARTTMLAACSPVESNMEETLSTLRYAASAKNIKTAAKKNEDPAQAKIRELSSELEMLKNRLNEVEQGGGGGDVMVRRQGSTLGEMTKEDKEKLFAELNNQLGHLNDNTFSSFKASSRRKSTVFGLSVKSVLSKAKQVQEYPRLSCLNKDSLLSHAMTIPIAKSVPFTIGRTLSIAAQEGEVKNNFELNGMGMKGRHCRFDLAPGVTVPSEGLVIKSLSRGATVFVNGIELPDENSSDEEVTILKHLDRIVLGPGRLLSLYLTKPLEPFEREAWDYDACFKEMIQRGKVSTRQSLISSTRRTIVSEMNNVQLEQIVQANTIATEMGVPVRFTTDMVVKGKHGMEDPDLSVDDFLDSNDLRLLVRCFADKNQHIMTAQDLAKATATLDEKNSQNRSESKPVVTKKHVPKSAFKLWESVEEKQPSIQTNGLGVVMEDDEEEEDHEENEKDPKQNEEEEEAEDNFNATLFELNLFEFEDLLQDMKLAHASIATLTGGLMDVSSGEVAKDMIHNVFKLLDEDGSGKIDRDELERGLMIFNTDQDHETFLEVIWAEENLPEHISMSYEDFEQFLIRFMQRQFYRCIEAHVQNRRLFVELGGRDLQSLAKAVVKDRAAQRSLQASLRMNRGEASKAPLTALLTELGLNSKAFEFSQAGFGSLPTSTSRQSMNEFDPKTLTQNLLLNQLLEAVKMKSVAIEAQVSEVLENKYKGLEAEKADVLRQLIELQTLNEMRGKDISEIKAEESEVKKKMVAKSKEEKNALTSLEKSKTHLSKLEMEAETAQYDLAELKKELKEQESLSFVMKTSMNALARKLGLMQADVTAASSTRRGSVTEVVEAGLEEWELKLQTNASPVPTQSSESIEVDRKKIQDQLADLIKQEKERNDEMSQAMAELEEEMLDGMNRMSTTEYDESADDERAAYVVALGDKVKLLSAQADELQMEKLSVERQLEKIEADGALVSCTTELNRLASENAAIEKELVKNRLEVTKKTVESEEADQVFSKQTAEVSKLESQTRALEEEVKTLERRALALKSAASIDNKPDINDNGNSAVQRKRIADLEAQVKELEEKVNNSASGTSTEELENELNDAQDTVLTLQERVDELEANESNLLALTASLNEAKEEMAAGLNREQELEDQLIELQESSESAPGGNGEVQFLKDQLTAAKEELAVLTSKLNAALAQGKAARAESAARQKEATNEIENLNRNFEIKLTEKEKASKSMEKNLQETISKLKLAEETLQQMKKPGGITDTELMDRVTAAEAVREHTKNMLVAARKEAETLKIERDAAVKQAKIEGGAAAAARRMAAAARVERDDSYQTAREEASAAIKAANDEAKAAKLERDNAVAQARAEAKAAMGAAVLAAKMKSEVADQVDQAPGRPSSPRVKLSDRKALEEKRRKEAEEDSRSKKSMLRPSVFTSALSMVNFPSSPTSSSKSPQRRSPNPSRSRNKDSQFEPTAGSTEESEWGISNLVGGFLGNGVKAEDQELLLDDVDDDEDFPFIDAGSTM